MTDDVLTLVRMANIVPDLADLDPDEVRESQTAIDEALRVERTPGLSYLEASRSRLRPLMVAGAVAAVLLLIVGLPALLSRNAEETPIVEEPAPTTVAPTTTPATTSIPATTAPPPQTTEATAPPTTAVALPEVPDVIIPKIELPQSRGGVNGMAAGGPGLVAVGETEERPGQPAVSSPVGQGAVWVSADGQSWTTIDGSGLFWITEQQADEGLTRRFTDITNGPAGLVVVGEEGYDGMAWTSSDGINWSRAANDEALGGNDIQTLDRVVAGGPGYVAVGRNGSTAGVWTSPDGETWTLVENESFGSYSEPATAWDVAALPTGIVVVGSGGDLTPDRWGLSWGGDTPAIWVSQNGLVWDQLPLDAFGEAEPFFFESVETSGEAFYLESTRDDVLQQWMSPDGRTWTRTNWPACESDEPGAILFAERPGAECRGIGYLEAPHGAEVDVNRMTRIGSLLIITGEIYIPDEDLYQPAMWIGSLDD